MDKKLVIGVIASFVIGVGAGYIAPHPASGAPSARGQFGNTRTNGARPASMNAAFGSITAKDANTITLSLGGSNASSTNGTASGSRIVIYDPSTQVEKTVSGSMSDLTVGTSVLVNGSANADGSITAQSIQIRPAGSGFGRPSGQ